MRLLITGGNGYVASSLYKAYKDQYDVTCITRHDFDLTAFEAMNKFFQGKYFDVVIHCAVQGGSRLRQDTFKVMDINLVMYYNLLQHKHHYGKLIHFGSGAEIYSPESPYGLSKRVIANSINEMDRFYNIRIFGVFDENELNTRFIKANILRYIKKEPMMIQNKKMSFFYMKDLITLVDHYINTDDSKLLKVSNCSYINEYTMLQIADMINSLADYTVPIYMDLTEVSDYVSNLNAPYNLDYVGLKQGITHVYNKLKNGK
jgi:GDP-L-fucose synthase